MDKQINEELQRGAIYYPNSKKFKALLAARADVNFRFPDINFSYDDGCTLLHFIKNAEIAKVLLLYGASVNATNKYRETPLDHIAFYGGSADFARVLLRYGADVDAQNRRGNTPLHQADSLELVKELLKYKPFINLKNKNGSTPLDFAVKRGVTYAKLLIKFSVLNHFSYNDSQINLNPYKNQELRNYLHKCVVEYERMNTHQIFVGRSLVEIIKMQISDNNVFKKLMNIDFSVKYPIYNDVIIDMVEERKHALDKLNNIQIYTYVDPPHEDVKGNYIILDYYSTLNITEYLSNVDLLNLIDIFEIFHVPLQPDLVSQLDETLETQDSKRARIE